MHCLCSGLFNWNFEENLRVASQHLKRSLDQVIFLGASEMIACRIAAQHRSQYAHVARGKTPALVIHVFLPDLTGLKGRPLLGPSIIPIRPTIISEVSDIKEPAQMWPAVGRQC